MSRFDEQFARMRELCTYGIVNESNKESRDLEYHKTAADGNEYGIIKENSKYYIKISTPEKKNIVESYRYIGGITNKKSYQYDSYNKALKDFELKLSSINEAHDQKVCIETLDPFKRQELVVEATDKMAAEIARQRQIMYNTAMIMQESNVPVINKACTTDQPEAEHGKSSDESVKATANPEFKGSKVGLDKKAEPFKEDPKAKGMNECSEPFNETVKENMDGTDFAAGLGGDGTGEADTEHNNGPFTKTVNEAEEADEEVLIDSEDGDVEVEDDDYDIVDGEDGEYPEVDDFEDVDDDIDDIDADVEDEDIDGEASTEELMAKISELEMQLADLKAQVGGEDNTFDEEGSEEVDADVEADVEEVPADEDESEFEEEGDEEVSDEDFEDEEVEDETDIETYMEAIRKKVDTISENVMKQIVNEDTTVLHDFGKHPGYRKKPFTTPPVGPDGGENVKDWNDESAKGDKPFGEKIGSSFPFDETVTNHIIENALRKVTEALTGKKKA